MYAKIFTSLFDGSMRGHADLILVFVNLLCHADQDGTVDRHWQAIADETGLPVARVKAALLALEGPDGDSRTRTAEGRRIQRIDDARTWGWTVVNFQKYKDLRTAEERREYMRELMRAKREKEAVSSPLAPVSSPLAGVSNVSLLSVDAAVDKNTHTGAREANQPTPEPGTMPALVQAIRTARPEYARLTPAGIETFLRPAYGNPGLPAAVAEWCAVHANRGTGMDDPLSSVRKMVQRLTDPPEARRGRWDGKLEPSKVKCRE